MKEETFNVDPVKEMKKCLISETWGIFQLIWKINKFKNIIWLNRDSDACTEKCGLNSKNDNTLHVLFIIWTVLKRSKRQDNDPKQ
jgi:hypothetical protein